jgi:hypothetical protein
MSDRPECGLSAELIEAIAGIHEQCSIGVGECGYWGLGELGGVSAVFGIHWLSGKGRGLGGGGLFSPGFPNGMNCPFDARREACAQI